MTRKPATPADAVLLCSEELQARWRDLNARYFAALLPPISIVWSRRLTSSVGMFASRGGPRSPQTGGKTPAAQGDLLGFTIEIRNVGTGPADNLIITDVFPNFLTITNVNVNPAIGTFKSI